MTLFSKAQFLPVLLFLLEVLVYLEDLLCEVIWFRWQPSSTTLEDKLVLGKADEIWHAVIYGNNGDMRKTFEDLTNYTASSNVSRNGGVAFWSANPEVASSSSKMEEGIFFNRHKTNLQKVIENDVIKWVDDHEKCNTRVQARLQRIADQLANSSRRLTKKERVRVQDWEDSAVSILWAAIDRGHKSDVDYLLRERNQKLYVQNGVWQRTVLHKAVSNTDVELTRKILEGSSSTSQQAYINGEDLFCMTALHVLVDISWLGRKATVTEDPEKALEIFDSLHQHGANINAVDQGFMTPLHLMLSSALQQKTMNPENKLIVRMLHRLLEAGAEVGTKDIQGNTPLHTACELQIQCVIETLVSKGADLETLNFDRKTPRRVFLDCHGSEESWKRITILFRKVQKTDPEPPATSGKFLKRRDHVSKARMAVCEKSVVYCRYQQNNVAAENRNPFQWTATDHFVSGVLYPKNRLQDMTFLAQCGKEYQSAWDDIIESSRSLDQDEQELAQSSTIGKVEKVNSNTLLAKDSWKWVNFPANNITWIRDFIRDNSDIDDATWRFFDENIKVRAMRTNASRIRGPHALKMGSKAPKMCKNDHGENTKTGAMVSLVIPFIDIEVEDDVFSMTTHDGEAYSPFTGVDGVQMPQTLDQTSLNAESLSKLRCKEEQVIYRWSKKQGSAKLGQLPLEWRVRRPFTKLANLLRRVRKRVEMYEDERSAGSPYSRTEAIIDGKGTGSSTGISGIRKDGFPKWLMVRQLWLWKLNDGTILTAIPSRRNMYRADDLLETVKRSSLHGISDVDDLMKHIVQETVKFPEKFRRAGLGEHILDVFESEIASEADEEATFYNNFAENKWDSKQANRAINCTWHVKDIHDELCLIRNVFISQLKVVEQFSKVLVPKGAKYSADSEYIGALKSELKSMISRIGVMDGEATKTTESLSNITQAMLAQAALKEAEAARFMNFIILPFTIVTVIFTPLSFMTSLFAVNSDGFPHNEDGELRIPSDWFWRRMVIGEFGTLIPLFIFILFLYYWQQSPRDNSREQSGR